MHRQHSPQTKSSILLAEDDAELRELLSLALRNAGLTVVEASDGYALLDRLADAIEDDGSLGRYDLIVSDVRMPGYSGIDVLMGTRQLPGLPPVVLITGFGDPKTHDLAKRLGAVAVFDKPVDLDELCMAAWQHIKDKHAGHVTH